MILRIVKHELKLRICICITNFTRMKIKVFLPRVKLFSWIFKLFDIATKLIDEIGTPTLYFV